MENLKIWIKQCFRYTRLFSFKEAMCYKEREDEYKKKVLLSNKIFSYLEKELVKFGKVKFIHWGDFDKSSEYYNFIPDKQCAVILTDESKMPELVLNELLSMIGEIREDLIIIIEGNGLFYNNKYILNFGFKYA